MAKLIHMSLILFAVVAVAIGDVFLKKAALTGGLLQALTSPWMIAATLLYLFQILFFTYAFVAGWPLTVLCNMQTALYSLVILGAGLLHFNESLSLAQGFGVALAFAGIILMNFD